MLRQWNMVLPLGVLFMVVYHALPLLNDFATDFMRIKIFGEFTISFLYAIFLIFFVSLGTSIIYVLRALEMEEKTPW